MRKLIFLIFTIFVLNLSSTIINIPADQLTIQAGINTSVNGDTVLVQPGTYYEDINYSGKNITIGSLYYVSQDTSFVSITVIESPSGSAVKFESGEDSTAVLAGFTIQNSWAPYGAGIRCDSSSPILNHLIIVNNTANYYGGGIYCSNANPKLENVIIENNQANDNGGGIACTNSSPTIKKSIIHNNQSLDLGGGIYCYNSNPVLENVTIDANFSGQQSMDYGSGLYLCHNSSPAIINSIISNNTSKYGIYNDLNNLPGNPTICYSDFFNNYPEHFYGIDNSIGLNVTTNANQDSCDIYYNILLDPLFYDDLSLSIDSPCIDAGDPNYPLDPDGSFTDIGAKYYYDGIITLPTSQFSASVLSGYAPLTIYFADLSTQGTGDIINWYWEFGDGNYKFYNSFADSVLHTYTITGNYTVSLIVSDNLYQSDIEIKTEYVEVTNSENIIYVSPTGSNVNGIGTMQNPFATISHGMIMACIGDTVIALPGIYEENLNYDGNNITVGSMYLTTQDTSYISQTIINGNQNGSVITFESGEDSTAVLCGITLTNGTGTFISNINEIFGGGIYCIDSNPKLNNLIIMNNNITNEDYNSFGGGICIKNSELTLTNIKLINNESRTGGGLYCENSNININSSLLRENKSRGGGGAFIINSNVTFNNLNVERNFSNDGGGLHINSSLTNLIGVNIINNHCIDFGGGIFLGSGADAIFDNNNLCNIYLNYAGSYGNDIFSDNVNVNVIVDTFTVPTPSYYYIHPVDIINVTQQNSKIIPVNQDVYVSPNGSNSNSGLTQNDPVRSISFALALIQENELSTNTIFLSEGIYSPSSNNDEFPLNCKNHISLVGENEDSTILDGDHLYPIIFCEYDSLITISNMTIQNGNYDFAQYSGIKISHSDISLENLIIRQNDGIGIWANESEIIANYLLINNNSNTYEEARGGGIRIWECPMFLINNSTISNNSASFGGGIYLYVAGPPDNIIVSNTIVSNNYGEHGIYVDGMSNVNLEISYSDFFNNEFGNFYNVGDSIGMNVTTNTNGDSCDVFYNIQMDPLYVDLNNEDFHLMSNSPCINAGDPIYFDPDNTIRDIGYYYYSFMGIQGNVSLGGGFGDLTEVVVSTNGFSAIPDSLGNYELILNSPGIYDVTASLIQYNDSTNVNIQVLEGQLTQNVDFILYPSSQAQLSLPTDAMGIPGMQIQIPLTLANPEEDLIEGIESTIIFDDQILDCTGMNLNGGFLENEDYLIQSNTNVNGQVSFWIFATGTLSNGEGLLANLEFTVNSNTQNNDFSVLQFTDANLNDMTISTIDGLFTVNGELYSIAGNVNYFSENIPLENVIITLEGNITYNTSSDINGEYLFDEIFYGNYISSADKIDELGGLSPIDASRISRNCVGLYDFNCYEYIAADVSLNDYITSLDASRVARYGLSVIDTLNAESLNWVFVADSVSNFNLWPPIIYNSTKNYTPLNSNLTEEDFIGIRLGDVSGNWEPLRNEIVLSKSKSNNLSQRKNMNNHRSISENNREDPSASLPNINALPDSILLIPLQVDDLTDLEGMDITLEFNENVINSLGAILTDGILEDENYGFQVNYDNDGIILMSFYAMENLFTGSGVVAYLEFQVVGNLGDTTDLLFSQFIVNEVNYLDNTTNGSVNVTNTNANEIIFENQLFSNYPNPFNPVTKLSFNIREETKVILEIYNIKGQKIITILNEKLKAGNYEFIWNGTDEYGKQVCSGIYLYKLKTNNFEKCKKMLMLK